MKYIKAKWTESRGDQYDDWGNSLWFLELDEDNYPTRQLEVYSNGNRLKYNSQNMEDKYGRLGDQSIDAEDGWGERMQKTEFEIEWTIKALNDE